MADDVAAQLYALELQITRLVKVLGGGGQSPFNDPGTGGKNTRTGLGGMFGGGTAGGGTLNSTIKGLHGGIKLMHGEFHELAYAASTAAGKLGAFGIAATALFALYEGGMKLVKTYNKLSDVGLTFGGSMLNMAAEAGRAGLSLSEYAELATRNSRATLLMSNSIMRGVTVQEDSTRSSQTLSIAQTLVGRNLLDASAQIDRFAGSNTAASSASTNLGAQHDDTGSAAAQLQRVLLGAAGSASDFTHQQIAMGNSMAQAQQQIGGLSTLAKGSDTGALFASLGDAGRVAEEMTAKQATMGSMVDQLSDRLRATSGVTSTVSDSMAALRAEQAKSSTLTSLYNRQIGEATTSASSLAIAQGAADASATRFGADVGKSVADATDTFGKLSESQKRVSELTVAVDKGLSQAAASAFGPRATPPQAAAIEPSMLRLNQSVGTVSQSQQLFNDLLLNGNSQLSVLSGGLAQQVELTARGGHSIGMMSDAATNADAKLTAVTGSSDQVVKANQIQAASTLRTVVQSQKDVKSTTMTMGELQLAVRNNLSQFGFFGMSMTEVANATSDYMNTLVRTGQLNSTNDNERIESVKNLIGMSTDLSKVWGTSREAIMKSVNDAMHQTSFAAAASTMTAQQLTIARQAMTQVAALPDIGPKLTEMVAEEIGSGMPYVVSAMGKAIQDTGMGSVNDILVGRTRRAMDQGRELTTGEQAQNSTDLFNAISSNLNNLKLQAANGSEGARSLLQIYNSMSANAQTEIVDGRKRLYMNAQIYAQTLKTAAAEKSRQDALTKNMNTFTSAVQQVTGGFLEGFYSMIASMTGDSDGAAFKESMASLKASFITFGKFFGTIVGILLSPTSVSIFSFLMECLASLGRVISASIKVVGDSIDWIRDKLSYIPGIGKWFEKAPPAKDKDGKPVVEPTDQEKLKQQHATLLQSSDNDKQLAQGTGKEATDAKERLATLAKLDQDSGKSGTFDPQAVIDNRKRDEETSFAGRLKTISEAALAGGLPAYLMYSHVLNRGATHAAASQGGLVDRMMQKLPGGRTRIGRKIAAAEKAATEAAGAIGGGGCCDKLSGGLSDLTSMVDSHGKNAAKNAEKVVEATAEGGVKAAETAAETAVKASRAERAGLAVAKAGSAIWHAPARMAGAFMRAPGALMSMAKTGFGAARSSVGSVLSTMKGTLKAAGEGLTGIATKGIGKSLLKIVPGIGAAMGGVFAVQRAWQGDYLGAAGELVGGVASLVPGIGTAVDVAIQSGLLARDLYKANQDTSDANKTGQNTIVDATPSGMRVDGDPGINQPQAEADLDELATQRQELMNKVAEDNAAGNTDAAKTDGDKLQTIIELLAKANTDQRDANEETKLQRANASLMGGS